MLNISNELKNKDSMKPTETNFSNINEEEEINSNNLSPSDQRSLIFHLLYAADAYNYETNLDFIIENFSHGFNINIPKDSFVYQAAEKVIAERSELDNMIQPLLSNWRLERLGTITRLIIRQGAWELINSDLDIPIIINDYIELAKCFAEQDAFRLINGILDEFAKRENKPQEESK